MHNVHGDCGVSIRQVLRTLVRVGVPPQLCSHPQTALRGDLSYDPLLYAFARDYVGIRYYRIEPYRKQNQLQVVKSLLSIGVPCVFGMPLCSAILTDPRIDYRNCANEVIGGVTGVMVGYDDDFRISSRGALLFRSTWGVDWGDSGYGWISYRMLEAGLVQDLWTIFAPNWSGNGNFSFVS
ncbi:hypothetical protein [Novipirellula maiorica]|nr:hypothetical protein [Rhodopirellula maiorica]